MDSVRFGRALGFGARSAAKALAGAVDAASAPNPGRPVRLSPPGALTSVPPPQPRSSTPGPVISSPIASAARTAAKTTAHAVTQARKTRDGVSRGGRRFGEAVWGPFLKLSGVLWLEITGSFFGLFALFAGSTAWTHRGELRAPASQDARVHALVFLAMTLVFGYFCISSFVRAYRK